MNTDEEVWHLSKSRFLQAEASRWVLRNKFLEIALFAGAIAWGYFEFFFNGGYEYLKYLGLVVFVLAAIEIRARFGIYEGYFDGYEQGFMDAATRNCDYWGETHDQSSDNKMIKETMKEIRKVEGSISPENRESRSREVKKGFSNLVGIVLTWRKIR